MAIGPSLRGTLSTYVPTWLANVPGLRNLFSTLWTVALLGDCLREIALEGQFAAYPGVGTNTALPLIGASRGLVQGLSESDASFAVRARNWLVAAAEMGNAEGLVAEVQAYLVGQGSLGAGVYPVVVFVDRAGNKTTIDSSRVITTTTIAWHWDDSGGWVNEIGFVTPAIVDGYWSDGWLLIQDPYTHYTGFADANWLAAFGSGDQTIESLTPQAIVSAIESIADTWKGAHVYVRAIVWTANPAAYTPDGFQGNWSKNSAGTQVYSRAVANGYWQPLGGG